MKQVKAFVDEFPHKLFGSQGRLKATGRASELGKSVFPGETEASREVPGVLALAVDGEKQYFTIWRKAPRSIMNTSKTG